MVRNPVKAKVQGCYVDWREDAAILYWVLTFSFSGRKEMKACASKNIFLTHFDESKQIDDKKASYNSTQTWTNMRVMQYFIMRTKHIMTLA